MSQLVNISIDPSKPVMIDAEKITCINMYDDGALDIFGKEGSLFSAKPGQPEIDHAHVIKALADAGFTTLPPLKHMSGGDTEYYLMPSAVTFMAVSPTHENGQRRICVSDIESSVTEKELQVIFDVMKQSGSPLFDTKSDKHLSNALYGEAYEHLYLNPAMVSAVLGDAHAVRIVFKDKSWTLDLFERDSFDPNWDWNKGPPPFIKQEGCLVLADRLAAGLGELTSVQNGKYVNRGSVSSIQAEKNEKTGQDYLRVVLKNDQTLFFDTSGQEMADIISRLTAKNKAPVQKLVAPPLKP